ncbi:5-formyltetrahydrofolate cyclo-ligase [Natronospira proteinivora]|uniref:5-formyltetrahydrofolate cyclo-ligase n=1 Tax=Natronospira proteinivora TaxID=1807133 RepID=A0ABT1G8H3_9GAMM|nr:5-formyltetrahydrofolate cyclo-ligase [Natronospira proteinivora]MCP1727531.1 5-formyltetrahydrofolate cyclo-ligase [Natronospira proteinivora]
MASVAALRRELKRQRKQLPAAQRRDMSRQLCRHILNSHAFRNAGRFAAYLPFGGEPDLLPLIGIAAQQGKCCYLPRIDSRTGRLAFHRWQPGNMLVNNRFGIPEPSQQSPHTALFALDLILTPLLAFDPRGNRLGMGAGFYDRSFAFRRHRDCWHQPKLVGTAWAFQEQSNLDAQPWDVPLDAVVSELGWRCF